MSDREYTHDATRKERMVAFSGAWSVGRGNLETRDRGYSSKEMTFILPRECSGLSTVRRFDPLISVSDREGWRQIWFNRAVVMVERS